MADEAPDNEPADPPDGVFGNLPGTRPGTRSPRRGSNGAEERPRPDGSARRAAPPPPPPPPPPATAPDAPPPGAEREAPIAAEASGGQRVGSVEDLAWAGIAVAAEAATLGVRFVSRALEAARKPTDSG